MKVYLMHHANALSAEQDPERHLSDEGVKQSERMGGFLKAHGANPSRILHSEKQWTKETAERVAKAMGAPDKAVQAAYAINTDDPLDPFLAEIDGGNGDLMMAGHSDFLMRTASKLLTGDEKRPVIEFKPGNGTTFCLEGDGDSWVVAWAVRQEQLPG